MLNSLWWFIVCWRALLGLAVNWLDWPQQQCKALPLVQRGGADGAGASPLTREEALFHTVDSGVCCLVL